MQCNVREENVKQWNEFVIIYVYIYRNICIIFYIYILFDYLYYTLNNIYILYYVFNIASRRSGISWVSSSVFRWWRSGGALQQLVGILRSELDEPGGSGSRLRWSEVFEELHQVGEKVNQVWGWVNWVNQQVIMKILSELENHHDSNDS